MNSDWNEEFPNLYKLTSSPRAFAVELFYALEEGFRLFALAGAGLLMIYVFTHTIINYSAMGLVPGSDAAVVAREQVLYFWTIGRNILLGLLAVNFIMLAAVGAVQIMRKRYARLAKITYRFLWIVLLVVASHQLAILAVNTIIYFSKIPGAA